MSTTAESVDRGTKEGPLVLTESQSDGPDWGTQFPGKQPTDDSTSFGDANKFLASLEDNNSFVSTETNETEKFQLKPVFSWSTKAHPVDAQEEKVIEKEAASPSKDREAIKREAYEDLATSLRLVSKVKSHARQKIEGYKLTREEKRELQMQLLLEERSRSLIKAPVVKFENVPVTGEPGSNAATDNKEAELSLPSRPRITFCPRKEISGSKGKQLNTRTSERVDGKTFLGHVFGQLGMNDGGSELSDSSDNSDSGIGSGKGSRAWKLRQRDDQTGEESEREEEF
ncbi:hypothetical protein H0H92_009168 [Tricholoma furcatifolium]|nr:hypothetical protein H0H92_009168 [Tricholoma furcatifolium]